VRGGRALSKGSVQRRCKSNTSMLDGASLEEKIVNDMGKSF